MAVIRRTERGSRCTQWVSCDRDGNDGEFSEDLASSWLIKTSALNCHHTSSNIPVVHHRVNIRPATEATTDSLWPLRDAPEAKKAKRKPMAHTCLPLIGFQLHGEEGEATITWRVRMPGRGGPNPEWIRSRWYKSLADGALQGRAGSCWLEKDGYQKGKNKMVAINPKKS